MLLRREVTCDDDVERTCSDAHVAHLGAFGKARRDRVDVPQIHLESKEAIHGRAELPRVGDCHDAHHSLLV